MADGSWRAWGENSVGELGIPSRKLKDGAIENDYRTLSDWRPTPVAVPELSNLVERV